MYETTVWNNIDIKKGNEVNTFNPKEGQKLPYILYALTYFWNRF